MELFVRHLGVRNKVFRWGGRAAGGGVVKMLSVKGSQKKAIEEGRQRADCSEGQMSGKGVEKVS